MSLFYSCTNLFNSTSITSLAPEGKIKIIFIKNIDTCNSKLGGQIGCSGDPWQNDDSTKLQVELIFFNSFCLIRVL